jgi:hypothetical protein
MPTFTITSIALLCLTSFVSLLTILLPAISQRRRKQRPERIVCGRIEQIAHNGTISKTLQLHIPKQESVEVLLVSALSPGHLRVGQWLCVEGTDAQRLAKEAAYRMPATQGYLDAWRATVMPFWRRALKRPKARLWLLLSLLAMALSVAGFQLLRPLPKPDIPTFRYAYFKSAAHMREYKRRLWAHRFCFRSKRSDQAGPVRRYFKDGALHKTFYTGFKGARHGPQCTFSRDGQLTRREVYQYGRLSARLDADGAARQIILYGPSLRPLMRVLFSRGRIAHGDKPHGAVFALATSCRPDQPRAPSGPARPHPIALEVCHYKDGKLHGAQRTYYRNGWHLRGQYQNGYLDGQWSLWNVSNGLATLIAVKHHAKQRLWLIEVGDTKAIFAPSLPSLVLSPERDPY